MDTLNLAAMPTAGHVVAADLEQVTLDLAPVPLEEVLDFRRQPGDQHRTYARDLRQFVRDAAALSQDDQQQALDVHAMRSSGSVPASPRPNVGVSRHPHADPAGQARVSMCQAPPPAS